MGKFKNNPVLRIASEFGGGYAGDMGGQMIGDTLMSWVEALLHGKNYKQAKIKNIVNK